MFWWQFTREFYRLADERRQQQDSLAAPAGGTACVAFLHELPQMRAMQARIDELEAALEASNRAREAFLASMSHELRTPLNAIMGFSEMMREGVFGAVENPTYHAYAGHIHDSGTSLLGKINDLLDIAALDTGGTVMDEEDFSLHELFEQAADLHRHKADQRDQRVSLDCASNIRLFADRRKLLCALTHFLSNALRHSKDGSQVILMARIQPDDGVIISVRDAGEGIQPAQLTVIREALQRDSAYRNIEAGGIGLGLSLSRELAAQHEGRMMIDSIRHRGTVVSMILPKERIRAGMPAKRRRSL